MKVGLRTNYRAFLAAGTKANGTLYFGREASGVNITRHFQKIQAYTGADLDMSEHLQVANYGLGGHYLPHNDHVTEERKKTGDTGLLNTITGNRLATVLSYFTTPLAGGATIFPNLDVYAPAVKGDAVFWWNLDKAGKGIDWPTVHGACPVISGQKWASNEWVREAGNEFTRPCGLQPDEIDRIPGFTLA